MPTETKRSNSNSHLYSFILNCRNEFDMQIKLFAIKAIITNAAIDRVKEKKNQSVCNKHRECNHCHWEHADSLRDD